MARHAPDQSSPETVGRLLRGLIAAIARHGPRKVSISDICDEAHVSRGTFYRYFAGRDEVFTALADHIIDRWRRELDAAVTADPAPARRLRVVHDASLGLIEDRAAVRRLFRSESEVAVQFLEGRWAAIVGLVNDAIRPAYRGSGAAARSRAAADVLLRLLTTDLLLGDRDEATVDAQLGLLQAQAGAR